MPESRFKNANTLKGGNYWQNYVRKQSLYSSTSGINSMNLYMDKGSSDLSSATFNANYKKKSKNLNIIEILEKGIDYKKILRSGGKQGKFALPTGRLFGPRSGVLSGKWDVSSKSPSNHRAKLKYSWSI